MNKSECRCATPVCESRNGSLSFVSTSILRLYAAAFRIISSYIDSDEIALLKLINKIIENSKKIYVNLIISLSLKTSKLLTQLQRLYQPFQDNTYNYSFQLNSFILQISQIKKKREKTKASKVSGRTTIGVPEYGGQRCGGNTNNQKNESSRKRKKPVNVVVHKDIA